jgi:hypothetical protein
MQLAILTKLGVTGNDGVRAQLRSPAQHGMRANMTEGPDTHALAEFSPGLDTGSGMNFNGHRRVQALQ